jgi:hypothetical protein
MNTSLPPAHAPYSVAPIQPHPDELHVVTVVFDPRRFHSRYRLYRTFAKHMEDSGAKLLTVEVAFGDRPFEVTTADEPWNLQLRTNVELWHKERALQLGIQRLLQMVPGAKYIAWIDADVTFARSDWAQETMQMLQHHPVLQLFGTTSNLDPQGHVLWTCNSCFREFLEKGYHWGASKLAAGYDTHGHPGLAWAATRQALDTLGGLIDFCIAGSADSHMANALKGNWDRGVGVDSGKDLSNFSEGFRARLHRWGIQAETFHGNVGYVAGHLVHHWHGKSDKRGYKPRMDILEKWKFDPATDLQFDAQGLYQFTGNKPGMEAELKRTMITRNEDSIDV